MKKILIIVSFLVTTIFANNTDIKSSVVKIFTVSSKPNFRQPWTSIISRATGSGCIIDGDKILTNAHVVAHHTYIEVLKNGDTKKYEAKVLSINHQADLALITVKDKSFFKGTKALKIGDLPALQQKVDVYGFPEGGSTLSITSGVISRIEHQIYAYSGAKLLAIQIDAAVNPGNSGGPAISEGKVVGIVMQGKIRSQNIGYIIPTNVIKHYLTDLKDGKLDGYPMLGVEIETMENPSIKEMYNLKDKKIGVLINRVYPNSPTFGVLKPNDVLIAIDGKKVYSNAKVEFRDKEFTSFNYMLQEHQVGDEVKLRVLRDGREKGFKIKLDKTFKDLNLIKIAKFKDKLTYYIYGGFVFVPASIEYRFAQKYFDMFPTKKRDELVLLYRVLPSSLSRGFEKVRDMIVEKVNGKTPKNFKDFVKIIESGKSEFVVFEDDHNYKIVLKRSEVLKNRKSLLYKYNIKSYKSDDL